jgi:enoyl-CoA hydratase/carnithine racemase
MKPDFDRYFDRYEHVVMSRDESGVLEIRLHSDGESLVWGADAHAELSYAFSDVGADPGNRVVIITGTGDRFIADIDSSWVGVMTPAKWDLIFANGKRLLQRLLEIEVPVIGAVNGPATVHAELAVLSDIVIASETAYFSDAPHFRYGTVPGDGVHVVWPLLLGPNRGRYFLLTGQRLSASEAKELGIVAEVLPKSDVLRRAHEVAHQLASQHDITLRYTREAMVHALRRLILESVPYGLALEGLGAYATWPA